MARITRLVAFARRRDRVITLDELRAPGFSRDAVAHLVRTERIWRVYTGVYALEGPLSPRGWSRAAVARCAPRCAATHLSAAFLSDYVDRAPPEPQVTIARDTGERLRLVHTPMLSGPFATRSAPASASPDPRSRRFPEQRRIDFVWREHGLIVETDGRTTHDTFIAFTDDRVRDRQHTLLGFDTMRFTWHEVEIGTPVTRDLLAYFSRR